MKSYYLSACMLVFLFVMQACSKDEDNASQKQHDPNQPIVLTSFFFQAGGARDKILLDGNNFGTDAGEIEVYFNNARAAVVSSSGDRIYAIVPRLPGENPTIRVVIGENSATYDDTFDYTPQAQVTTVTGNGERDFQEGTLNTAQVYGKYLELDAEGNIFMSWRDGG